MEDRAWTFLYFITITGAVVLIVKYVSVALAAEYKMEAEKYKCERRTGYYEENIDSLSVIIIS